MKQILKEILVCSKCGKKLIQQNTENISCSGCNSVFLIEGGKFFFFQPPSDINVSAKFVEDQNNRSKWTRWRKRNFYFFKEKLANFDRKSTVLDLGVGPAQFKSLIQKEFPNTIGIDFLAFPEADVVSDLNNPLPFKNDAFDLIIASNILEHLPNTREMLTECFRVLKPGGAIMGTVPFLARVHQKPYDFFRFTYYMLDKYLYDSGFRNIEVNSLGSSPEAYKQIQKHLFYYLFDHSKEIKNPFIKWPFYLGVKILWQGEKFLNFIGGPIFKKCPNDPGYSMGYGFSGVKPN
jgi:ubiquinone/menaquinone biosynthesis C-methylase UbiE